MHELGQTQSGFLFIFMHEKINKKYLRKKTLIEVVLIHSWKSYEIPFTGF